MTVRLDGADTALVHVCDAASPGAITAGTRVQPRWRAETAMGGTGSLQDETYLSIGNHVDALLTAEECRDWNNCFAERGCRDERHHPLNRVLAGYSDPLRRASKISGGAGH